MGGPRNSKYGGLTLSRSLLFLLSVKTNADPLQSIKLSDEVSSRSSLLSERDVFITQIQYTVISDFFPFYHSLFSVFNHPSVSEI